MKINDKTIQSLMVRLTFKLRLIRETAQTKQLTAAEKLRVSHRSYQRIENGEVIADIEFLLRFSHLFGIDFDSLISPHPPKLSENIQLFSTPDSFQLFENIEDIQNSGILKIGSDFEKNLRVEKSLAMNFGNAFSQSSYNLLISKNMTKLVNQKTLNTLELNHNRLRMDISYNSVQEELLYWDHIFYYRPKYSIRKNVSFKFKENNYQFNVLRAHYYQGDDLFGIALLN